jgi:catalase
MNSQTPPEQAHIAAAFRFELSKVTVPAIRERMVASLRNGAPGGRRPGHGLA